jgi:hypothetical protein
MDNLNYLVNMYGIREPYKSELEFFKKRPEVAGMATEDNKIILNPFSTLSKPELDAVSRNEALRLFMRQNAVSPSFDLTKSQMEAFRGSEYEKDPSAAKQTILARILTGDPSAKDATLDQTLEAQNIMAKINKMARGNTPAGAMTANPQIMAQGLRTRGVVQPGNINLSQRPMIRNEDGSVSTVASMGVNFDGREMLIPMATERGLLSEDDAIRQYMATGQHLGQFASPEASTRYAKWLSSDQAGMYGLKPSLTNLMRKKQ